MSSTATPCITALNSPAPTPDTATKGSSQGVVRKIRRTRLHSEAVHIHTSQSLIISNAPQLSPFSQQQQSPANPDPYKTRTKNPAPNLIERIPYTHRPNQGPAPVPYPALGPPPSYPPPPPPFTPAPGDTFATRGEISAQRAWDAYTYGNGDSTTGHGHGGGQQSGHGGFDTNHTNMSMDPPVRTKKTNAKVLEWLNGQKD